MKNQPAIVASLEAINSRRDTFGNCYWAFSYLDHATGKTVNATISGGESNIRQIMFVMNGGNWEPRNVSFTTRELPIREFNRYAKSLPYAGCTGEDLVAFIKKSLA